MLIEDVRTADRYYRALIDRAADHVGVFVVGVKTTGVFCIATCRARKPRRENVVFYSAVEDAVHAGFRPCKVCRPTQAVSAVPPEVQHALALLEIASDVRLTDARLREQGLDPVALRRWFLRHRGITFQAHQRMRRVTRALDTLRTGATALDTALDTGYASLSGFNAAYERLLGATPIDHAQTQVIRLHRTTTPLGPMVIGASDHGICLLEFADRRALARELRDVQRARAARLLTGENVHTQQAERELHEYFSGRRRAFDVVLDTPGTPFQRHVWTALLALPFGSTSSYAHIATAIDRPTATRAVAAANGQNRVSIVIPCHRVIGSDGSLTGYGGGLARKQWLLDHERRVLNGTP